MRKLSLLLCAILSIISLLTSCGPIPLTKMTPQERVSDIQWIFGIYEQNYAPLEYKEKLHNFDNEDLKAKYLAEAKKDQSNTEFFRLMHSYVAEFKDAHNSGSLIPLGSRGYTSIAYLGFDGVRMGDNFKITKLLPTYKNSTGIDFQVGDVVTEMNGKPLKDLVDELITPVRNLGRKESNYSYLMRNLFLRSSLIHPMPGIIEFANLTIERKVDILSTKAEEIEIMVGWVTEDRVDFEANMKKAVAAQTGDAQTFVFGGNIMDANGNLKLRRLNSDFLLETMVKHTRVDKYVVTQYLKMFGLEFPKDAEYAFEKSFELVGNNADLSWAIVDSMRDAQGGFVYDAVITSNDKGEEEVKELPKPTFGFESVGRLKKARKLPSNYELVMIGTDENPKYPTYPAYIVDVETEIKKKIENKGDGEVATTVESETIKVKEKVGYIFLDTFSPPADSAAVVKEFVDTLKEFKKAGVKSLVIDTINNGGGSLQLGIELANALTDKKVELPGIQLKLSDTWIGQFKSGSENVGYNPTVKYANKILFEKLMKNKEEGKTISDTQPIESLGLIPTIKKEDKLSSDVKIVVLINEMCASMCDIFSGILQDNKMATIMGANSMGAGGNVVNHWQSPRSHFQVRMTESLIVRNDGSFVENVGTKPDIELVVNTDSEEKYKNIIDKALKEAARAQAQAALEQESATTVGEESSDSEGAETSEEKVASL